MDTSAYYIDLQIGAYNALVCSIDTDFLSAIVVEPAAGISVSLTSCIGRYTGYIAGTADGIVTVRGKAAAREILLMDANSRDYQFVGRIWSMDNGHYMFTDLDPDKQYLVLARDYKKEYEPFGYDYVTPATDLTPDEQMALFESWKK